VRGYRKLGEGGDSGRRKVPCGDESDTGNVCDAGVGVTDGLNKNVGDVGDILIAHIDPIGETTNPGEVA
jgi:hypothetical protein